MTNNDGSNTERSKKILIVDDDPDLVSTFKMILEMNGYEVDEKTALADFL